MRIVLYQILFCSFLISSCASSYKKLKPNEFNYFNKQENEQFDFAYQYGVLVNSKNKKYSKLEWKNNVMLVAIEFTNKTSKQINFSDLKFYRNDTLIELIKENQLKEQLKQKIGGYTFYSVPGILSLPGNLYNQEIIFIASSVLASGFNISLAANANKNLRHDLESYNLENKIIKPKEKVIGLIGVAFKHYRYDKITVELSN